MTLLSAKTWNGDEWQGRVAVLLGVRYGYENIQRVPAKHQGDWGIDVLVRQSTSTIVYQCYAPEEPLPSDKRYEKQRDKLTADVGKFLANGAEISKLISHPVHRWIMATPTFESKHLVVHAQTKTREVRQKPASHVTKDFEIVIHGEEDFRSESDTLVHKGQHRLSLASPHVADATVDSWSGGNNQLIDNLRGKLHKLHQVEPDPARVAMFVAQFLAVEERLRGLKDEYPEIWEEVIGSIERRRKHLEMFGTDPGYTAHANLRHEMKALREDLDKSLVTVVDGSLQDIVDGTIAGWLLTCPLRFD